MAKIIHPGGLRAGGLRAGEYGVTVPGVGASGSILGASWEHPIRAREHPIRSKWEHREHVGSTANRREHLREHREHDRQRREHLREHEAGGGSIWGRMKAVGGRR